MYLLFYIIKQKNSISKLMKSNPRLTFTIILALLHVLNTNTVKMSNILCDGNFEDYPLHVTNQIEDCAYLASNYSCWYNSIGGPNEIKLRADPPITTYG